jgi:hypothetical protein
MNNKETLEEYYLSSIKSVLSCNNDYQAIRLMEIYFDRKSQEQRMYSEEEVKKIALDFSEYLENNSPKEKGFDGKNIIYQSKLDLFEQFKKK